MTLGREGASIANKDGSWRLAARPVTARSAVATGGSFASTATVALTQGQSLDAVPMALLPVQPALVVFGSSGSIRLSHSAPLPVDNSRQIGELQDVERDRHDHGRFACGPMEGN